MYDALEMPVSAETSMKLGRVPLTKTDAIEIWIARWLRVSRKDLVARYGCDSRRLYEIWWGEKFPGSREDAERAFADRYPALVDRTVFGYRRIARPTVPDGQLDLFAPHIQRALIEHKVIVEQLKNKDGQDRANNACSRCVPERPSSE